jgi:formylglycine-generating enzyme required for sulfatase activity
MTKLGKYEILEEIGRGGFAVVYKARDTVLDRIVALKVLHPHWTADAGFVARFHREARAAANLRHPHIVTVHDAGEAEGQLYIAMEYLPGRTLRALLEAEGPLSLEQALPILEQTAEALDYAHAQGVVHRDVKPGNVMVEETERGVQATLMDFGLVKAMTGSSVLTSQGTLLGSPEYMAPEQADPERAAEVDPATDRYALGVVAYHMLTGRVPFPGNTPATLNAHEHKPVPPPRALRPGLSRAVEAALLKMLAKTPTDRFASARAFVARLRGAPPRPARRPIPTWAWWAAAGGAALVLLLALSVTLGPHLFTQEPTPELGATWIRPADGMVMVYVPAGEFEMGSTEGDDDEQPVHTVALDGFWIDQTEVTNAQYRRCVQAGDCSPPTDGGSRTRVSYYGTSNYENYPAIYVTWNRAAEYCAWAGGRLPTEAEWEYAARGPEGYTYPWGDGAPDCSKANYWGQDGGCVGDTTAAGSYPAGASWCGALDMAGNVWEWVADRYGDYPSERQVNPTGPSSGEHRVLRGGSWNHNQSDVRCASRSDPPRGDYFGRIGFRCARVSR